MLITKFKSKCWFVIRDAVCYLFFSLSSHTFLFRFLYKLITSSKILNFFSGCAKLSSLWKLSINFILFYFDRVRVFIFKIDWNFVVPIAKQKKIMIIIIIMKYFHVPQELFTQTQSKWCGSTKTTNSTSCCLWCLDLC